eukprot:6491495-Amphidinium_carterae.8
MCRPEMCGMRKESSLAMHCPSSYLNLFLLLAIATAGQLTVPGPTSGLRWTPAQYSVVATTIFASRNESNMTRCSRRMTLYLSVRHMDGDKPKQAKSLRLRYCSEDGKNTTQQQSMKCGEASLSASHGHRVTSTPFLF